MGKSSTEREKITEKQRAKQSRGGAEMDVVSIVRDNLWAVVKVKIDMAAYRRSQEAFCEHERECKRVPCQECLRLSRGETAAFGVLEASHSALEERVRGYAPSAGVGDELVRLVFIAIGLIKGGEGERESI